ncbi:MAG: phage holin family protein [Lachnospiraceae bacterium]|nr:phage holin family protein [Lachnospiraceae bacterium]
MKNYFYAVKMLDVEGLSLSAAFTFIAAALGRIPVILILFIAAVIIDYVTGWIKAKYFLKDWNSKTGLQGIIKKLLYFVMIGTAFLIGWGIKEMGAGAGVNLDFAMLIGWYVTAVMLINEFTSILENLYVIMPEKVPVWLIKTLKIADEKIEGKINDLVCKNQNCEKCELKERCNLKKEV